MSHFPLSHFENSLCRIFTVYFPFLMPKVVVQNTGLVISAGSQKVGPNNLEDTLPW